MNILQKIRTSKTLVLCIYVLLLVMVVNAHSERLPAYFLFQVSPSVEYVAIRYANDEDVLHHASAIETSKAGVFTRAVYPVAKIPNWGAMRTPKEWNRTFSELTESDLVSVPTYDLAILTQPLRSMLRPMNENNIRKVTSKLFYSTRFFGAYNLDAGEFTAGHPGMDFKLAKGTPIGAIGGGIVRTVGEDKYLGLHVIIEHVLPNGEKIFSIYGHLSETFVHKDKAVFAGQMIARIGTTGYSSAPHLHLQIDKDNGSNPHTVYWPDTLPTQEEAAKHTLHPVDFIETH